MKTLTIDFSIRHTIGLRLKGLSFKALAGTDVVWDVCISDDSERRYQIAVREFYIDGKTAQPKIEKVVDWLSEIKDFVPFDKIKINGYYQVSADELLMLVEAKIHKDEN